MKNVLTRIRFDEADRATNYGECDEVFILGLFNIVDESNNKVFEDIEFAFEINDESLFKIFANEKMYEWLLTLCEVTTKLYTNNSLTLLYNYQINGFDPREDALIFSLNNDCLMIQKVEYRGLPKYSDEPQESLPKEFDKCIDFQPINFQSWIEQVIATVNEFIDFVCSQNKTLEPHMHMQRMIKQVKEIEGYNN